MPHWRGVLRPEEVVPFFKSANGSTGLLMRDLFHGYPPLIVLHSDPLAGTLAGWHASQPVPDD